MNIMTLLANYPRMPAKNPDKLLMAEAVDHLSAQLINLGVKKAPPSAALGALDCFVTETGSTQSESGDTLLSVKERK